MAISETMSVTPNAYLPGESSYSQAQYMTTPVGLSSDNTNNNTYAMVAKGYLSYSFDLSSIPDGATADSVVCKARLRSTGTTISGYAQLYSGMTAKGTATTFTSTDYLVYTLNPGTWTRAELQSLRLRIGTNTDPYKYIYFLGADLTVTYTYQNKKFMLKLGGAYNDIARTFKKVSGIWVEQTDLANVVDQTKRLVNGGEYVVELPEGYTRLEYIESTGSQYIDWGFKPNQDTRVVFQFYPVTTSGSYILGSRASSSSSDKFAVLHPGGASYVRDDYGSEMTNVDILFDGLTIIDKNKNVTKIGGTTTTHTAATFESANLFLFANNTGGTAASMTSIQAVRAQAYKNGLPIRDSIPCLNPSGVPGFYDVMEDVFYGSASGTAFVPGPEYSGTISPGEPSE